MQTEIEAIIKEMTKLYLMGTVNQGKINGNQLDVTAVWIDLDAKRRYEQLGELLSMRQRAEQIAQADQNCAE